MDKSSLRLLFDIDLVQFCQDGGKMYDSGEDNKITLTQISPLFQSYLVEDRWEVFS